jgi:hypothetical protein
VKGLAGLMLGVVRSKLACGVFCCSPEICRVPRLLHKVEHDILLVWPGRCGGQVMSGIGVEAVLSPWGLRRFTIKPSGLLSLARKPRPEARRAETGSERVEKL